MSIDRTFEPERTPQDDEFVGEAPPGDASPDDYMSSEQSGGESPETGVIYDRTGEPEITPHDEEAMAEEDA
jgi:hypothetical protein